MACGCQKTNPAAANLPPPDPLAGTLLYQVVCDGVVVAQYPQVDLVAAREDAVERGCRLRSVQHP